ncbi:deoxyribodipyrimidine photo-lyase [Teredinibacter sp. KSP-S5-2]|uniref:cryptochrome/photolyase family protein n=1 Tax=Teredinibacter sp. KSP-S5-2 TaxID=3034506 RepID=UPI002935069F|nr:deoxyribodipyrimidine photo-lyase [Teredinibacter sp. KSP-S5-2]WNO09269.1 deoxyribodipyrimidine photo-lyase [Teredinibacter sp. KSP-S5-2]
MSEAPILVCLRNDLRLADHPPLFAAKQTNRQIVVCYVFDEKATPALGGASRWWLQQSLASMQEKLAKMGGRLILRRGKWAETVDCLAKALNAESVFWSRAYEPYYLKEEELLKKKLSKRGIEAKRFGGSLLFEPDAIYNQAGLPFKVFTPFWKACLKLPEPKAPLKNITSLNFMPVEEITSLSLDDLSLLPQEERWADKFHSYWLPGEKGAHKNLKTFTQCVDEYDHERDVPGVEGTSQLSPHLHFGEISPRQVWHTISVLGGEGNGAANYLRELGWREFSYYLLFHWPHIVNKPFNTKFEGFPWKKDKHLLKRWQQGETGIPLVDAGMRQLWETGWMHNRVRMVVASLLVKNGMVPWQEGEKYFWDTLVDADLASNSASWQWVAGCGADAAPYFRIFNPVTQSQKFDARGDYIRRWLPELSKLPDKWIHAPWTAPQAILEQAGVKLDHDYPSPVIDLAESRRQALDIYQLFKAG